MRKIGFVALARRLLIASWRYLETGIIPEGAMLRGRVHKVRVLGFRPTRIGGSSRASRPERLGRSGQSVLAREGWEMR